jgi:hypothetical protein
MGAHYPHSYLHIVLEFLARAIRQEEGRKEVQIGKETQNILICRWYGPIP